MTLAKKRVLGACAALFCVPLLGTSTTLAQPLVTGDLTIYYDFDSFTDIVMDGSGNGFNGKVQDSTRPTLDIGFDLFTSGVISNDTTNPKRGAGAIRIAQSEIPGEDPVFLDMDGSVIKANAPTKVPKEAITVAAWLNLPVVDGSLGGNSNLNSPASIYQAASSGPSYVTHFHAEGNGTIRLALRGENQNQNIVNSSGDPYSGHPYPNQPDIDANGAVPEPWPLGEWFHVAFTYDKNANGGTGEFAMYYNGTKIRGGAPNGLTDGFPTGAIDLGAWDTRSFSDWYDGLGLGAVMDSGGRRLHGLVDEYYIFSRALSESEIGTLVSLAAAGLDGDFNDNQVVDAADYTVWRDALGTSATLPNDPTPGTVDASDYDVWKSNFGTTAASAAGAQAVPEPASVGLLMLAVGILAVRYRR